MVTYFIAPDDDAAAAVAGAIGGPEDYPNERVTLDVLVMLPSLVELVTGQPPRPGQPREVPLAMEGEAVVDWVDPQIARALGSIDDQDRASIASRWVSQEQQFDADAAAWALDLLVPLAREGVARAWPLYLYVVP